MSKSFEILFGGIRQGFIYKQAINLKTLLKSLVRNYTEKWYNSEPNNLERVYI